MGTIPTSDILLNNYCILLVNKRRLNTLTKNRNPDRGDGVIDNTDCRPSMKNKYPHKNLVLQHMQKSLPWSYRDRRSPGTCWVGALANSLSSKFSERPRLQKWEQLKKSQCSALPMCTHKQPRKMTQEAFLWTVIIGAFKNPINAFDFCPTWYLYMLTFPD